jgi:hypothetical protein
VGELSVSTVVLLGPQQPTPDVGAALALAHVKGPVALVTAGWQERESDDQALVESLGMKAVNLTLHARSEQVFAEDKPFAAAHKAKQGRLRLVNDFYPHPSRPRVRGRALHLRAARRPRALG